MNTQAKTSKTITLFGSTTLLMSALVASNAHAVAMKADFNGDGLDDMVMAIPSEDISNKSNAGAVKVVYGRNNQGVDRFSSTAYLHQRLYNAGGIDLYGVAESSDGFGNSVAVGDFNNDGYDDLAVGVYKESIGSTYIYTGMVNIVYGSYTGLRATNNHLLNLQRYQDGGMVHSFNYFGSSLAVGDYDGDGIDDLAVSFLGGKTPSQGLRGGGAALFFGAPVVGLNGAEDAAKTHILREPWSYIHEYTAFGSELSSGDYNNDGIDDLAIAAPQDTEYYWKNGSYQAIKSGSVSIALGSSDWNATPPTLTKIKPGNGTATHNGKFGETLASGNLDSDSADELAIAAPRSGVSNGPTGGVILIHNYYGYDYIYYQSRNDIPGSSKNGDRFGQSMSIADFNDDGRKDLAIGVPGKSIAPSFWDWNGTASYGEVVVLYTSTTNLFYKASIYHQGTPAIEGGRETNDNFGSALSYGDFNNDGVADLLVGVKYESVGSVNYTGVVQFIWGDDDGLTGNKPGQQLFHQASFSGAGFGGGELEVYDYLGDVLVP